MPHLLRRPFARLFACAVAAMLSLAVAPEVASACAVATDGETQAFAAAGDGAWYTLAPGGDFSSSLLPGWTLDGALVGHGFGWGRFPNWLTVEAGGYALSAPVCVGTNTPTMRFWARQVNPATWAEMTVALIWTNPNGTVQSVESGAQSTTFRWGPSPVYNLGNELPISGSQTLMVQVEFFPAAGGSAVQISDLYVDPYSRG